MALIKIYSEPNKANQLNEIAKAVKLICAAALNCPEISTKPSQVETVATNGIDLVGIDYILEVICAKRPNMQNIGNNIISGLNSIYPNILFSVYFNIIEVDGMAATSRSLINDKPVTMDEAIKLLS